MDWVSDNDPDFFEFAFIGLQQDAEAKQVEIEADRSRMSLDDLDMCDATERAIGPDVRDLPRILVQSEG